MANESISQRYAASDQELAGYFTSAVGLRAASLEAGTPKEFDTWAAAERLLDAAKGLRWHDRVGSTLARLGPEERHVLALVYAPHHWPLTWVADALSTPWGGGSLVALAATLPRILEASARDRELFEAEWGRPLPAAEWLMTRWRTEAHEVARLRDLFGKLVRDAEAMRMTALVAYEAVRVKRKGKQRVASMVSGIVGGMRRAA